MDEAHCVSQWGARALAHTTQCLGSHGEPSLHGWKLFTCWHVRDARRPRLPAGLQGPLGLQAQVSHSSFGRYPHIAASPFCVFCCFSTSMTSSQSTEPGLLCCDASPRFCTSRRNKHTLQAWSGSVTHGRPFSACRCQWPSCMRASLIRRPEKKNLKPLAGTRTCRCWR